jgi:hypothetical protein
MRDTTFIPFSKYENQAHMHTPIQTNWYMNRVVWRDLSASTQLKLERWAGVVVCVCVEALVGIENST